MSFMHDTTPEAEQVYYDIIAGKSSAERVSRGLALSRQVRLIVQAAIKQQHPEYSEHEALRAYVERITTRGEYERLFGPL